MTAGVAQPAAEAQPTHRPAMSVLLHPARVPRR